MPPGNPARELNTPSPLKPWPRKMAKTDGAFKRRHALTHNRRARRSDFLLGLNSRPVEVL